MEDEPKIIDDGTGKPKLTAAGIMTIAKNLAAENQRLQQVKE